MEENPGQRTVHPPGFLHWGEWAFIGLVVAAVVVLNKLVIHDEGSTWVSLITMPFAYGLLLVMLNRWRQERGRSRARRQGAWHPDPTGRFAHRWWEGAAWTDQVSDGISTSSDPLPPK